MATDTLPRTPYPPESIFVNGPVGDPVPQGIPTSGPATHPNGPREYSYPSSSNSSHFQPPPPGSELTGAPNLLDGHPKQDIFVAQTAAEIYNRSREVSAAPSSTSGEPSSHQPGGAGANHYPSSGGVPRLPPILQVERLQVTTSATQMASASRRRNEAHFVCPVPGCGSTFTRRFNLRGTYTISNLVSRLTYLTQVIYDHIQKNGHTYAIGLGARKALRGNMTASGLHCSFIDLLVHSLEGATKHYTRPNHKPISVKVVKRHLVG